MTESDTISSGREVHQEEQYIKKRSASKGQYRGKSGRDMIVRFLKTEEITEERWRGMWESLSAERQQKARTCGTGKGQLQSVAAGFLLETMLKESKIDPPYHYKTTENGRPYLLLPDGGCGEERGIFFSISHTDGMVACALDHGPVGIDVEPLDEKKAGRLGKRISGRFFTEEEKRYLEEIMCREKDGKISDFTQAFYSIWTCKEAAAKFLDQPLTKVIGRVNCVKRVSEQNSPERQEYVLRKELMCDGQQMRLRFMREKGNAADYMVAICSAAENGGENH